MIEISRMADPLSNRKIYIKIKTDNKEALKKLFYDNHFPYEENEKHIYIRANQFENLIDILTGLEYDIRSKHLSKRAESFKIPKPLPTQDERKGVSFKKEPYKSQLESTQNALAKRTSLIADKMGKGKTFTGIMIAEQLASVYQFKHVLILNGVSNNQYNWEREVKNFSYREPYIIGSREIKQGPRKGLRRIGSNLDKLDDLEGDIEAFYLIANIHMLRDRKILDRLKEMMYNGTIGAVIVDEVHKCIGITAPKDLDKNKKTKVPALQELRPYFRVGMSGTPFNEPTDLYDIEAWLGRAYATKVQYQERYGMMVVDSSKMFLQKKYRFVPQKYVMTEFDLFSKEIQRYIVRSAETVDLPPVSFENYYVELYPEQLKALDAEGEDLSLRFLAALQLEEMQNEVGKPQHMTKRKIVSLPILEGIDKDAKRDALKEILEEIIANGDSAVVFTYFKEASTYYKDTLGLEGGIFVEDKDGPDEIFSKAQRFQDGEGNFLVGGYGKLGTGLNIERADYAIFVDTPLTWNDYEQSLYRLLRGTRGDRPVYVIKLVAVDTYDEIIQDSVRERKLQQDVIMGKSMTDKAVEE